MKTIHNGLLYDTLFAMGYSVVKHTGDASVRELIRSLRPRDCGKKLIRVGGDGDGGYLIPDDLEGLEYCFSPGVSTVADFESELADRGIRSFMADYSVDAPPVIRPEFVFDKKFLGSNDSEKFFTLATWKNKYLSGYSGDLLLQMDIEGAEYEVLSNMTDELMDQFRIIVIEFHKLQRLFDPFSYQLYEAGFQKLLKHFYVAHIHPNNFGGIVRKGDLEIPKLLEITFYNKKRVCEVKNANMFPNPLDVDCNPEYATMALPKCWYAD